MTTLSAVLIMKNEEARIARAIESLWGVDEIVILDTGSTDRSIEIAEQAGAKVFRTDPIVPFHFGEARNRALSYATFDWCISLDADEIAAKGAIKTLKRRLAAEHDAAMVKFVMRGEGIEKDYPIQKMKVFRRSVYTWKYRVHEMLVPSNPDAVVVNLPEVVFEHLPDPDKSRRHAQNLELLRLSVQESPEYVRNVRQLALELMLAEQWDEAITCLKQWLECMPTFDPYERCQSFIYMAQAHEGASGIEKLGPEYEEKMKREPHRATELGREYLSRINLSRIDESLNCYSMATEEHPWRREPLWYAAKILYRIGHVAEAIPWLEKAVSIPKSKRPGLYLDAPKAWEGAPEEMLEDAKQRLRTT